jgi:hypothetical protein
MFAPPDAGPAGELVNRGATFRNSEETIGCFPSGNIVD